MLIFYKIHDIKTFWYLKKRRACYFYQRLWPAIGKELPW